MSVNKFSAKNIRGTKNPSKVKESPMALAAQRERKEEQKRGKSVKNGIKNLWQKVESLPTCRLSFEY